jgi:septal ring factor EnvC (AmiA/AmiB activator)
MISASAGSQVHAVHGGRVVFADWLRGAGLLVILDHGNGFESLRSQPDAAQVGG